MFLIAAAYIATTSLCNTPTLPQIPEPPSLVRNQPYAANLNNKVTLRIPHVCQSQRWVQNLAVLRAQGGPKITEQSTARTATAQPSIPT